MNTSPIWLFRVIEGQKEKSPAAVKLTGLKNENEVSMTNQLTDDKEGFASIEGPELPLVKQGIYKFVFVSYETVRLFGGKSPKLILWFRIVSEGEHFGVTLPRYYNVKRIIGKPRKNGDFSIGRNSNFAREYAELFSIPRRLDRMPMTIFKNKMIKGKSKTVTSGFNQKKIHKTLQYSVISELLEVHEL
jgi:hypothetical protein